MRIETRNPNPREKKGRRDLPGLCAANPAGLVVAREKNYNAPACRRTTVAVRERTPSRRSTLARGLEHGHKTARRRHARAKACARWRVAPRRRPPPASRTGRRHHYSEQEEDREEKKLNED